MWSTLKGLVEEAGGAAGVRGIRELLAQLQVVQDEPVAVVGTLRLFVVLL